MSIEKRAEVPPEEFLSRYLAPGQPVVVTDALASWPALGRWTPGHFREQFGSELAQVYDDLFGLVDITTLAEYLDRYFDKPGGLAGDDKRHPYVRWYAELKKYEGFPWADGVFARLQADWALPYFLPADSYLVPYCPPGGTIDPTTDKFPAKGLFISAAGCRTRLHKDPWASDAILCQLHGRKRVVMFSPAQEPLLTSEGATVDLDGPDLAKFPRFEEAEPAFEFSLEPGEALLIPSGWYHHVDTIDDTISLTWNFVHTVSWPRFYRYLTQAPPEDELATISFFLSGCGHSH